MLQIIQPKRFSEGCISSHSFIISQNGAVFGSGSNKDGQLGVGNYTRSFSTPQEIKFDQKIKQIATGINHSLFLDENGVVYSCGNNYHSQLGLGNNNKKTKPRNLPQIIEKFHEPIVEICCSSISSLFRGISGKVYGCGCQLGLNYYNDQPFPIEIPTKDEKIGQISASIKHAILLTITHKILVFGSNSYGRIGFSSENKYIKYPTETLLSKKNEKINQIKCGYDFSLFLDSEGKLFGCGRNDNFQLGFDSNGKTQFSIVEINTNQQKISKILSVGAFHSFVLNEKNEIFCFGSNSDGQLGLQDSSIKNSTFRKFEFHSKIIQIESIGVHTFFLSQNGEIFSCGYNNYGQLCLGTLTPKEHKIQLTKFDRLLCLFPWTRKLHFSFTHPFQKIVYFLLWLIYFQDEYYYFSEISEDVLIYVVIPLIPDEFCI